MQNYDGIVLFWLLSVDAEDTDQSTELNSFRTIIKDTRIFYDPDECIESMVAIVDETVFLLLGPNRSYLMSVLSSFTHLHYIYLSEPLQCASYTNEIRGVFPRKEELLHQLQKDVTIARNTASHMSFSSSGEFTGLQTSIKSLYLDKTRFRWTNLLFHTLLQTPRSTEEEKSYADLLYECRLICRGNEFHMKAIDEFEKTYHPIKSIWWYTRDSFLYKLVNTALRTENMVVIWKFRFIIQDIYQQLKILHEEQKKTASGNPSKPLIVYRGQLISQIELENLKKAEGDLIATTCFLSTSTDRTVAEAFCGGVALCSNLIAIIFEIFIDQSDSGSKIQHYADISKISYFHEENEIMMCMGTVMRIESVHNLAEGIAHVRLRTCLYEDSLYPDVTINISSYMSSSTIGESGSLFKLAVILSYMEEHQKARELFNMIKRFNHPVVDNLVKSWSVVVGWRQTLDMTIPELQSKIVQTLNELKKLQQQTLDFVLSSLPEQFRAIIKHRVNEEAPDLYLLNSVSSHVFGRFIRYIGTHIKTLERFLTIMPLLETSSTDLLYSTILNLFSKQVEKNDLQVNSTNDFLLMFKMNTEQIAKCLNRGAMCSITAIIAFEEGDYDRAIKLIQEALLVPCIKDVHFVLYKILIIIYNNQENWSAVIEACQSIIHMPQLVARSSVIVEAHIECGNAHIKLNDTSAAFSDYERALKIQYEHYPPDHPLTGEVHIKIGQLFKQAGNVTLALENYHKAISSSDADVASEAHIKIGLIYYNMDHYNKMRSNLTQALEIQKNRNLQNTICLVHAYTILIRVEHKTGHYQQRDFYIDQLLSITDKDPWMHKHIEDSVDDIMNYVKTTPK